jgi:hypothetical protein
MKLIANIFSLMTVVVLLSCCDCMAAEGKWSLKDEVYACGTSGMTLEELASAGVTLLSHGPWGGEGKSPEQAKAFLEEAHRYGIRVIPYVTLYKVIDSSQVTDTYHTKAHPFFKELDLVDHPEWALIDENGNIRRPFDAPTYRSGVHQSCTNVAGLAQAYVRGVKNVMEMGFDGVFVDNVHPYPTCYGPKFGKHEHIYPDKDNVFTYHLALKQVYDLVKQYGDDKVVMLNTGNGPSEVYADCDDGTMVESYICTFVDKGRKNRWNSFGQIMDWARQYVDYMASGKGLVALSYMGWTGYPLKDDAFYCGACGKLSGFVWTANVWATSWTTKPGDRAGNDILRLLYRANLKNPLTEIKEKDGVTYRVFAGGIVAVNPGDSYLEMQLPAPDGFTEVCDLYCGRIIPVIAGQITIRIPPESGRLYISPDAAFSSYLKECVVAARGVQQRLNQLRDNVDIPSWTIRDSTRLMGQGQVTLDRTQPHSGGACLKVTSGGSGQKVGANQAGMMFMQDEAQEYSVSYWARVAPGTGASARLLFEADFKEGGNGYWSPPEITQSEWTHQQGTYVSPKPIHDIEVLCSASYDKPTTVWFDDIVVTSAGKSDWLGNGGFEQANETVAAPVETRLRQWLQENMAGLESMSKTHKAIPASDNRYRFIAEMAGQQNKLPELIGCQSDDIIRRRLQNLREYSGRVLSMATGITLGIDAPRIVVPGDTIIARVNLKDSNTAVQGLQLVMEVPQDWKAKSISNPGKSDTIEFEISIPQTAPVSFPATITAIASFEYKNGHDEKLCLTVVEMHGLQIADKGTQKTNQDGITPEEHQKLHADPK